MRRLLLSSTLLFTIPAAVLALDFSDSTSQYTDAPFTLAERAAISMLTNLGAVEGYPDGSFKPNQTLNRAEFLKIVLQSNPHVRAANEDAVDCFPDVRAADWFSKYVCLSKRRGIVGGYPDGNFKPAQNVNYVEALKILSELYEFNTAPADGEEWFMQYVHLADARDLLLPINLEYGALLTRGQMARLAAAFRADHEGELDIYRLAERSIDDAIEAQENGSSSSSSSTSTGSTTSSSSVSSVSSVSSISSSSVFSVSLYPAKSALLMLGSDKTDLLADGSFSARDFSAEVLSVRVDMTREVESIEEMYFVDAEGEVITNLRLDPFNTNDDKKKWVGTVPDEMNLMITGTGSSMFGIMAKLYTRESARSTPEELVKVNDFILSVQPTIGDPYVVYAADAHMPQHQVVQAEVTKVTNLRSSGELKNGNKQLLGEFRFEAESLPGAVPAIEHLTFTVDSLNTSVTNWKVGSASNATTSQCALDGLGIISCVVIPSQIGLIGANGVEIQLFGDVAITGDDASLQVNLNSPGAIGANGAVRWTDGVGHYTWIRTSTPVAKGMLLEN